MIFNLAIRNLLRHKKHTLIIYLLFTFVIALFFIGNGFLNQSSLGLREKFIDNFTGDLTIKAPTDVAVSLLGATTPAVGEYYVIPPLLELEKILSLLKKERQVTDFTEVVTGWTRLEVEKRSDFVPLLGIQGEDYFRFFDSLEIVRGRALGDSESGTMITEARAQELEEELGRELRIGEPILMTTYGIHGFKIQEVPLLGIFRYSEADLFLDKLVFVDLQTIRSLNSISLALENQVLEQEETSLLDSEEGQDFLFDEDIFFDTEEEVIQESEENSLLSGLAEAVTPTVSSLEENAWEGGSVHFILLKLNQRSWAWYQKWKLRRVMDKNDLETNVISWRQAAGLSAQILLLLRLFYNVGFSLIAIASVIGMVNILLIALFERTKEIGTLRAIGAKKLFVAKVLLVENLSLAFLGGVTGMLLGTLALLWLKSLNLHIANELLVSLFGRDTFDIALRLPIFLLTLSVAVLLGFFATLYPLAKALKISPVAALRRD